MTQPSGDETTRRLPDIPECDVETLDDGQLLVRHKATGQAETVTGWRKAELAGMKLRILASYASADGVPAMRPIPLPWDGTAPEFRAGYLP